MEIRGRLSEGEVGAAQTSPARGAANGSAWALIGPGRLRVAIDCQSDCSAPVMYGPISLLFCLPLAALRSLDAV